MMKLKRRVWCPKCHRHLLPVPGFELKIWRCGGCKRTFNVKATVEPIPVNAIKFSPDTPPFNDLTNPPIQSGGANRPEADPAVEL